MQTQLKDLEKQNMETRSAIVDKLGVVEDKIRDAVQDVRSSVTAVKNRLDLKKQVEDHPVTMVAGSILTGLVLGTAVSRSHKDRDSRNPFTSRLKSKEKTSKPSGQASEESSWSPSEPIYSEAEEVGSAGDSRYQPSLLERVANNFSEEIQMVKAVAIGEGLRFLEKKAKQRAPNLAPYIGKVVEGVTRKLEPEDSGTG